jgi:hypothetical protein
MKWEAFFQVLAGQYRQTIPLYEQGRLWTLWFRMTFAMCSAAIIIIRNMQNEGWGV